MLSSTASALLCLAVGHAGASDLIAEPTCNLNLLQVGLESELALAPNMASQRAECKDWCEVNTFHWTAKCGWPTCGGCDSCHFWVGPAAPPTPPPTTKVEGCGGWCAANTAPWKHKCGWGACHACEICASVTLPTVRPTPSPTPSPEGCQSWCADDAARWEAKCTWRNCRTCDICDSVTLPTARPTPSPTIQGCGSYCAGDPAGWEAKCTWQSCHACDICNSIATPSPTTPPTQARPTPSPTHITDTECEGGILPGDGNGAETQLGFVDSMYECIQKVKAERPDANAATYSNDGSRECYAEVGETDIREENSAWISCIFKQEQAPTQSTACDDTALDNSKCNSWLLDACCGIELTVGCTEGYEVVRTGTCGLLGLKIQYTCKPPC